MSDQLFAAIRRGKVKPGMTNEFAKRVKAGALPVMQKMDGFKGYYLVAGADDTIIAVSLFSNQQTAQTSTQTLMPWIKETAVAGSFAVRRDANGPELTCGATVKCLFSWVELRDILADGDATLRDYRY